MKRTLGGSALIIFGIIEIFVYRNTYEFHMVDSPIFTIFCFFVVVVAPLYFGIVILCNFKPFQYIKSKRDSYLLNRKAKKTPSAIRRDLEKQLLKLAYTHGGVLTVIDVSLHTDMVLEEAQEALEYMVKHSHANIKIAQNGTVLYQFRGILTDQEKKADKSLDELLDEKS
ncbi:hypothetical protein [Paenibacillus sp. 1_12]|uniref:hypothetical protein n=1 Tax=Paenibacillus sp. 1_12 TaxID=1566278 RepID=UPI001160A9E0|nr:hypothetical protein [Paenibacillus sp. 1_12]